MRVTSACTDAKFTPPDFKPLMVKNKMIKKYDPTRWDIATIYPPMDDVSALAIRDYARPPPPTKVLFCGGIEHELRITSWKPYKAALDELSSKNFNTN